MKMLLLLLALSACATEPKYITERIYITTVPPATVAHTESRLTITGVRKIKMLEDSEQSLVAEAGRYVVWQQSKPQIIKNLGTLLAVEKHAMKQLHEARTLSDRAAAIPAVEAAQDAILTYLKVKGD